MAEANQRQPAKCGMTIEEKINPVNGATAENNTYEYEFIYNFVVEQK